jgi:D-3-phosphoglycerate dehydrogenase
MIARDELNMMKPGAMIINTSRGGIINELDLLAAMSEKGLIAALDVFEIEPQVGTELIVHPNLYPTPHIGGNAKEAVLEMGHAAILNLINHSANL